MGSASERAALRHGGGRIHVAGGEHDHPGAREPSGHVGGDHGIEGPGQIGPGGGAELHARQEEDVVEPRESLDRERIQEIAGDGVDAVRLELARDLGGGEARHGGDPPGTSGRVRGPPHQAAERGAHLASGAEHHHVAPEARHEGDIGLAGPREQLLELLFALHLGGDVGRWSVARGHGRLIHRGRRTREDVTTGEGHQTKRRRGPRVDAGTTLRHAVRTSLEGLSGTLSRERSPPCCRWCWRPGLP